MRILQPNDRPYYDWRDPNMKVLGFGYKRDTRESVVYEETAEERQEKSQNAIAYAERLPEIHWRNDHSYNWRRKK